MIANAYVYVLDFSCDDLRAVNIERLICYIGVA